MNDAPYGHECYIPCNGVDSDGLIAPQITIRGEPAKNGDEANKPGNTDKV